MQWLSGAGKDKRTSAGKQRRKSVAANTNSADEHATEHAADEIRAQLPAVRAECEQRDGHATSTVRRVVAQKVRQKKFAYSAPPRAPFDTGAPSGVKSARSCMWVDCGVEKVLGATPAPRGTPMLPIYSVALALVALWLTRILQLLLRGRSSRPSAHRQSGQWRSSVSRRPHCRDTRAAERSRPVSLYARSDYVIADTGSYEARHASRRSNARVAATRNTRSTMCRAAARVGQSVFEFHLRQLYAAAQRARWCYGYGRVAALQWTWNVYTRRRVVPVAAIRRRQALHRRLRRIYCACRLFITKRKAIGSHGRPLPGAMAAASESTQGRVHRQGVLTLDGRVLCYTYIGRRERDRGVHAYSVSTTIETSKLHRLVLHAPFSRRLRVANL